MRKKPPHDKSPFQLLVEGKDDQFTILNLIEQAAADKSAIPPLYVRDCEGQQQLLGESLPLILKNKQAYAVVGVVVDADENCGSVWQSLRGVFSRAQISLPEAIPARGLIQESRERDHVLRIGIWIMPDNSSVGKLENFVATLVPEGDLCWPYCDEVVDGAKARLAPFAEKDRDKAKLHTWLAWREKPGVPYGLALKAGDFGVRSLLAERFREWFRDLYQIIPE